MAKLMTSLAQCSQRMTWGERRVAQRLETHLGDDCLIWYDIPVGRQYQHPDFVIIDPSSGLIFLEVKDWRRSTFCHADPLAVILETGQGAKREKNPLVQVREYACATAEMLSREPLLQQTGIYQGKLNVAWAYGVVFTNITRQQLNALSADGTVEAVFPEALTICQDEMTESVSPQAFRNKIAGLFTTRFRPELEKNPVILANVQQAMRNLGIVPKPLVMRGGYDGSVITSRGLSTVNIFTGAHNFHSTREFLPVESLRLAGEMLLEMVELSCREVTT